MLTLPLYVTNTLPIEKTEEFIDVQIGWNFDRKESEEEKNVFQNKCVSSQNRRYKKRRGRHRSGVSPTFP
jgi:hypothetical protein